MITKIIKKKIKQAVFELAKSLIDMISSAEYKYNPKTKQFSVRFKKDW